MLLQHVDGPFKVGVASTKLVQFWRQGPPFKEHTDIVGGVTNEWWAQLEVVYVPSKKNGNQGVWTDQLRKANAKAKTIAKKRAVEERDPSVEQIAKETDEWHAEIFEHAIERISLLLSSKEHFVKELPKKGKRTVFEKRVPRRLSWQSCEKHQGWSLGTCGWNRMERSNVSNAEWGCMQGYHGETSNGWHESDVP